MRAYIYICIYKRVLRGSISKNTSSLLTLPRVLSLSREPTFTQVNFPQRSLIISGSLAENDLPLMRHPKRLRHPVLPLPRVLSLSRELTFT